jgi:hypothetical protein
MTTPRPRGTNAEIHADRTTTTTWTTRLAVILCFLVLGVRDEAGASVPVISGLSGASGIAAKALRLPGGYLSLSPSFPIYLSIYLSVYLSLLPPRLLVDEQRRALFSPPSARGWFLLSSSRAHLHLSRAVGSRYARRSTES